MEQSIAGRCALITGSTSGIGLGIAKMMAAAGARVMINGFGTADEIALAKREIAKAGNSAEPPYSAADLSDPSQIRTMCSDAEQAFGQIDILVNNAGIQFVSPITEFPDAKWDAILAINLSANFHAIKALLPGMDARGWGRIINIASIHGIVASPEKVAYVAAKHGVIGMTRTVALEMATSAVTCNAICPGFVRTPLAEKQVAALAEKHGVTEEVALKNFLLERQPSKRWVEVDEVARMALYLCGPDSSSINGAAFSIDGGWSAA